MAQTHAPDLAGRRGHLAIALVACATLVFEIGITRVLSVVLWYHFAFLSISLALLGLGAPGVWFALRRPGRSAVSHVLIAAGLLVPASVIAIVQLGDRFQDHAWFWVAVLLAPFLALGSAVCLLLMAAPGQRVSRMYAADLIGATVGAVALIPLMGIIPTPVLVAGAGVLPLLALGVAVPGRRVWAGGLGVAVTAVCVWGSPFALSYTKEYAETQAPLYERWTPTARLAVFETPPFAQGRKATFGWGIGSKAPKEYVEQFWLEQDGSAGTPITRLDRPVEDIQHLFFDVTSVGYQVGKPQRVCIIGTGGGRDILTALKAGATEIDAVELNGVTVELVSQELGAFSGDVYHLPGVNAVVAEGRSFLTRADGNYDLIQVSLTDSWAATAAGAYSLSENNLYTLEAMRLYWQRLSDDGMVSISRWSMGERRMESARLALLAVDALAHESVEDPRRHLAVLQAGAVATLLVSRQPFDEARLAKFGAVAAERGFGWIWPPQGQLRGPTAKVLADGPQALTDTGFDLSSPTDDRPFFFHTVPLIGGPAPELFEGLSENERAVSPLRGLLVITCGVAVLAFLVPLALRRRVGHGHSFWRGCGYFSAIGMAFMFVEMPLIQRFVLFLGHPSRAAVLVLATLLCGAGLGAFASGRVGVERAAKLAIVVPIVIIATALGVDVLISVALGQSYAVRAAVAVAALLPAAFVMGFAFPVGMVSFAEQDKPWFWALNGFFGVLASVFSLALAMELGFRMVIWTGVASYLVAVLLIRKGT
jgi:hypothetical protein